MSKSFFKLTTLVLVFGTTKLFGQSYDQLKMQLQFENYYGTRMKSNGVSDNISGPQYLFETWLPAEITFADGSAQFDQCKLNLLNSGAEVVYKEKEMFISPTNFKSLKLLNQGGLFMPGNKYFYKEVALAGIVEIFSNELTPPYIIQQHFVYVKEPSTNGYVSGGSTERKFIKSTAIFLHDGTKLLPIKGRQSLLKFYKQNKNNFERLEETLNTNFKDPKSIQKFIDAMKEVSKE